MEHVLRKIKPNHYRQGSSNFVYIWSLKICKWNEENENQLYVESSRYFQTTIKAPFNNSRIERVSWIITMLVLNIHIMTKLYYLLCTLYGRAGDLYLFLFIMYSATTSPDSIILSFISVNKYIYYKSHIAEFQLAQATFINFKYVACLVF